MLVFVVYLWKRKRYKMEKTKSALEFEWEAWVKTAPDGWKDIPFTIWESIDKKLDRMKEKRIIDEIETENSYPTHAICIKPEEKIRDYEYDNGVIKWVD